MNDEQEYPWIGFNNANEIMCIVIFTSENKGVVLYHSDNHAIIFELMGIREEVYEKAYGITIPLTGGYPKLMKTVNSKAYSKVILFTRSHEGILLEGEAAYETDGAFHTGWLDCNDTDHWGPYEQT